MNNIDQLKSSARDSLRACYEGSALVASPMHFSDFWARDSFWALPGMLAVGDYDRARDTITFFLSYQRDDGKIPRKISRDYNAIKYLTGKSIPRRTVRPTYHGIVKPFYAKDSELLMLIATAKYLDATRDYDFVDEHFQQFHKAMMWHAERVTDKLIDEAFLDNWMDTVFKSGPVLYTNVLYVLALEAMVTIAQVAGRDEDGQYWAVRAHSTKRAVRAAFWNGSFFADQAQLRDQPVEDQAFDLAGNTLAVLAGVADESMRVVVLDKIEMYYGRHGAFLPAVPTGHKWYKINPFVALLGIGDYHTKTSWLWIDMLVVRTFVENGRASVGKKILAELSEKIIDDEQVGETYFQSGASYARGFWKSATPFAWSSGVILESLVAIGLTEDDVMYEKPEPRIC